MSSREEGLIPALPLLARTRVSGVRCRAALDFTLVDQDRLAAGYINEVSGPRRMSDLEIVPLPFMPKAEGLRMALSRAFDGNAYPSGGAGMIGASAAEVKSDAARREVGDASPTSA